MNKTKGDYVIEHMLSEGWPMLLSTYLNLTYGDVSGLGEVGPEDRVEIEDLLAHGTLKILTPGSALEQ
jgi:hypothetical protein